MSVTTCRETGQNFIVFKFSVTHCIWHHASSERVHSFYEQNRIDLALESRIRRIFEIGSSVSVLMKTQFTAPGRLSCRQHRNLHNSASNDSLTEPANKARKAQKLYCRSICLGFLLSHANTSHALTLCVMLNRHLVRQGKFQSFWCEP